MTTLLVLLLTSVLPKLLQTGCVWKDPGFDSNPKGDELSPEYLNVEWGQGIVNDVDCVDHFYVHWWKSNFEERNTGQRIQLNKSTFSVEISVTDDTEYSIQINAFEDGNAAWMGDNWSNVISIHTSKVTTTTTTTTTTLSTTTTEAFIRTDITLVNATSFDYNSLYKEYGTEIDYAEIKTFAILIGSTGASILLFMCLGVVFLIRRRRKLKKEKGKYNETRIEDIDDENYDDINNSDDQEDVDRSKALKTNHDENQQIHSFTEEGSLEVKELVDNPYYDNFEETPRLKSSDAIDIRLRDTIKNITILQSTLNPYYCPDVIS